MTEVGPGDAWRSVAVAGVARSLTNSEERQAAIEVLVAHNRRVRASTGEQPSVPRRRAGGRLLRIERTVITGRAFG